MELFYERIEWENYPSMKSPVNETNLNKIDYAAKVLDERTVELSTVKAEKATVLNTVQDWTINEKTGVITITKVNGTKISFDLNLEKVPVSFALSEEGVLTMETEDGKVYTADIGSMIPIIELESSSTVSVIKDSGISELATNIKNFTYTFDNPFTGKICIKASFNQTYNAKIITEDGEIGGLVSGSYFPYVKNALSFSVESTIDLERIYLDYSHIQKYKFEIPDGAITEQKLNPNYLADIKLQAENATQSATSASASATQASESATRAYDEAERAKLYADTVQEGITTTTSRTLTESHAGGLKINSMDGESQQKQYSGKNLLPNTASTNTTKGITFTVNADKSITVKGTATGIVYLTVGKMKPIANQSYIFSHGVPWEDAVQCYLEGVDGGSNWITPRTFTPTTDTEFSCLIYIANGKTVDLTFKPMIRVASITDGTYEPFVGNQPSPNPDYPQDIKSVVVSEIKGVGKNLFSSDLLTNLYDGYNDSTRGFGVMCDSAYKPFYKTNFKENTVYTISALVRHASYDYATFVVVYKDGSYDAASRGVVGEYALCTLTTNGTKTVDYIGVRYWGGIVRYMDMQIEEGSVATPFEEHIENTVTLSTPITLRGIGDVKDSIVKQDGVYKTVQRINRETFTIDDAWGVATAQGFACIGTSKKSLRTDYAWSGKVSNIATDIFIGDSGCNFKTELSLEDFKTAISDLIVEVLQPLTEPIITELPIADQIALHQLETFDTVTYISTDSEIEPIMEMEYGTSKVGAYAIKGINTADANALKIEQLNTLTNDIATQLVAGSEV